MAEHNEIGKYGEDLTIKFLEAKGYTIFDRNYNFEKAEIDIVAFKPNEIHFVEVKTRKNSWIDDPEIMVPESKQKLIARAAEVYLWERQFTTVPAVFDVIMVALEDKENPVFRHFENAYRPEGNFLI